MENIENKSNFLFYSTESGTTNIQVVLEEETVWATQGSMSEIFDVEENTITYHISNIFSDGELLRSATTRKIRVVRLEAKRNVSRELEKKGEVFIDLLHNDSIDKQSRVLKELDSSDVLILIETNSVYQSEWVVLEIEQANAIPIPIQIMSLDQLRKFKV